MPLELNVQNKHKPVIQYLDSMPRLHLGNLGATSSPTLNAPPAQAVPACPTQRHNDPAVTKQTNPPNKDILMKRYKEVDIQH